MVGRVRCLGAYKADFTVHDVPIPQEKHIPEIDSVAQVGEKPKVPVLFNGLAALVCHDFFYLFHRQGYFQNPVAPCVIHHAFKGFHIEIYGGDGLALVPQELVKA